MPPWDREAHLGRYRQVAEVLTRHGLAYLVGVLGLGRFAPSHPPAAGEHATPTPPEHVRIALEELGTTFVKLGQLLSTRSDLLGEQVESGMLGINSFVIAMPEAPFGGVKESGHGSEEGVEGLEACLVTKFITET